MPIIKNMTIICTRTLTAFFAKIEVEGKIKATNNIGIIEHKTPSLKHASKSLNVKIINSKKQHNQIMAPAIMKGTSGSAYEPNMGIFSTRAVLP